MNTTPARTKFSRPVQLGLLALLVLAGAYGAYRVLRPATPPAPAVSVAASATPQGVHSPAPVVTPAVPVAGSHPAWKDLSAEQRLALAPLQGVWAELDSQRKRKWMVISKNYAQMSAEEQSKLSTRMKSWAALPRDERIEARQNFLATQKISPELKTQQWEAYQQLSAEEKQKLAAKAPVVRSQPGVAVSKPTQGDKLADVPVIQHPYELAPEPGFKLAVPAQALDRKTLLPTSAQAPETSTTTAN